MIKFPSTRTLRFRSSPSRHSTPPNGYSLHFMATVVSSNTPTPFIFLIKLLISTKILKNNKLVLGSWVVHLFSTFFRPTSRNCRRHRVLSHGRSIYICKVLSCTHAHFCTSLWHTKPASMRRTKENQWPWVRLYMRTCLSEGRSSHEKYIEWTPFWQISPQIWAV